MGKRLCHPTGGINGKVVIVTGGAGGIGSAICRRFGTEGAKVAAFDINQEAAAAISAEIRNQGGKAQAYAVDLTSQESVIAAVTAPRHGRGCVVNWPGLPYSSRVSSCAIC